MTHNADYAITRSSEDGQALVEFSIAFPIQLIIVLTLIQLAYIYIGHVVVQYAAFSSARSYMAANNAKSMSEYPWPDDVTPRDVARKTAAIICTPITGSTPGDNPQAAIKFPGWTGGRGLDRSGIAMDPGITLVTVVDTKDDGSRDEVTVTVRYRMELILPMACYLLNDMVSDSGEDLDRVELNEVFPMPGTEPSIGRERSALLDDNDFGGVPRREIVETCTVPYPEGALWETVEN